MLPVFWLLGGSGSVKSAMRLTGERYCSNCCILAVWSGHGAFPFAGYESVAGLFLAFVC